MAAYVVTTIRVVVLAMFAQNTLFRSDCRCNEMARSSMNTPSVRTAKRGKAR